MKTNFGSVTEAVRALRNGGVVLVPTETVVGLVSTEAGLEKIYALKGRDENKPVALLCRDAEEAFIHASEIPEAAKTLASRFWPGGLTLVMKSRFGGNIGLRVPLGTVRGLLDAYGEPLYATSANVSGEAAVRALGGVSRSIIEGVDVVMAGEPGRGEASAVVDVSGDEPKIIRASERLDGEILRSILSE